MSQEEPTITLESRLARIRTPNQKNQQQVSIVLNAVESTFKEQSTEASATAYFVALLSLLSEAIPSNGDLNKDLASPIVYLLDLVTPYAPAPLLRSKFSDILVHLAPALTHPDAEAPLTRSSLGVLESLLIAQDGPSWMATQQEISPRRGLAGLLAMGMDGRPKVRKRAQEAITKVLSNPPPSPKLDHPAAEMCAISALTSVTTAAQEVGKQKGQNDSKAIHALQLVSAIAKASGWPSSKIEPLCQILLAITRSSNEFLTVSAFDVFESIFGTLEDNETSTKLPIIIEAIAEVRPNQSDSQVLPAWLAVMSRGYEVLAKVQPNQAFRSLPQLFELAATFLESPSEAIRTSAQQFIISLIINCIPHSVILRPTAEDNAVLEKLAKIVTQLLAVRYQGAWMEVFDIVGVFLENLKWRANPLLLEAVKIIGDLRSNEGFQGKIQADSVLGYAIHAMGPQAVLTALPLNLTHPKPGQPGRAWMLPLLRDHVSNTNLAHFISEFVPLSEMIFQKVVDHGSEKTMEVKIYETLVQQIWAILPGYCDSPLDLQKSFDQSFAELLANVLYQQVDLRSDVCKALEYLVNSNTALVNAEDEEVLEMRRISREEAKKNIELLASLSSNLLAVLFNVYSQTLPQYRGSILRAINAFISISSPQELVDTFQKVYVMLEDALKVSPAPLTQAEKEKKKGEPALPPMSHTLMDLVIALAPHLPAESHQVLLSIFAIIMNKKEDPQLQKKSYKIVTRLAQSELGQQTLRAQSAQMQKVLIDSVDNVAPPARRDRLLAIADVLEYLDKDDLHFIPSILSEVVISAKEVNEKARTAAFDLLVAMGEKMKQGGTVVQSKVPHLPDDAPSVPATLEEYFTMVAAGLAGSTPHMISASITALTRILYQFKDEVSAEMVTEMVSTMDLFLTSKNREMVQSVLGFVKVSVISLPRELMIPRLESLIKNLMIWSHEHKAHFKAKVKHIMERMIRRFGYDIVEKYMPEEDKKLIINIRKTRDRRKKNKEAGEGDEEEEEQRPTSKKQRYASAYEEAVYGSESEDSGSDVEMYDDQGSKQKKSKKGSVYIVENEDDDPLDLLDRKTLGAISSTRPMQAREARLKTKTKINSQGKMVIGGADSDDDGGYEDVDEDDGGAGGVNAYLEAVSGNDAYQRGQRNRVKFSNKRSRGTDEFDNESDDESKPKGGKGDSLKPSHSRRGSGQGGNFGGRVQKSGSNGNFSRGGGRGGSRGGSFGGRGGGRGGSGGSFGGRGGGRGGSGGFRGGRGGSGRGGRGGSRGGRD